MSTLSYYWGRKEADLHKSPWNKMSLFIRDYPAFDALDLLTNQLIASLQDTRANTTDKTNTVSTTNNNTANQPISRRFWGNTFARLDFRETDTNYIIHTDVPGIPKDEVNVTIRDDVLTISGERKSVYEATDDDKKQRHIVERRFGKFSRSVRLPQDVNVDDVNAKMENGVLELRIGKRKGGENDVKKINIH
ncbi:hypothetical protein HDU76_003104 [Blyttiomyces sp. JEL0837]|nr:hypothetical protein HDU76_003104 [Blyttiomyces sp. JEL0837]